MSQCSSRWKPNAVFAAATPWFWSDPPVRTTVTPSRLNASSDEAFTADASPCACRCRATTVKSTSARSPLTSTNVWRPGWPQHRRRRAHDGSPSGKLGPPSTGCARSRRCLGSRRPSQHPSRRRGHIGRCAHQPCHRRSRSRSRAGSRAAAPPSDALAARPARSASERGQVLLVNEVTTWQASTTGGTTSLPREARLGLRCGSRATGAGTPSGSGNVLTRD